MIGTGIDWRSLVRRGFAVVVIICLAVSWWVMVLPGTEPVTTHFSNGHPPVSPDRCAVCHVQQSQSLQQAPHTITLQRGSDDLVAQSFGGQTFQDPQANGVVDRFEIRDHQLWRHSPALPDPVPIDWVFGSGQHARTPVTVLPDPSGRIEVVEHRLSWYPGVGIDLTLGMSDKSPPKPGWHGVGKRLNADDAADCFGCHSAWLPSPDGRLDLARIQPGVRCSRCHQEGDAHLQSANAGQPEFSQPRWKELSPLESIRRCGECHRRDDQMTPYELRTTNPLLVRFAPVGISQSPCFTRQDRLAPTETGGKLRLDCLTCHDPHRAAETRSEYYTARCITCHTGQAGRAVHCSDKDASQNCLECHMPKIEVQPHLRFTDHWIRARE